jgi:hypothetical protein
VAFLIYIYIYVWNPLNLSITFIFTLLSLKRVILRKVDFTLYETPLVKKRKIKNLFYKNQNFFLLIINKKLFYFIISAIITIIKMSTQISTAVTNSNKRFDGRVFHVHCDATPTSNDFDLEINGDGEEWGYFTPDIFLVISSQDLMNSIQDQLRKQLTSKYEAKAVTLQLADSNGERGSEMISSNLASRLITFINTIRGRALQFFKEEGLDGCNVRDTSADIVPTQAGIRLYPKLPAVKNDADATKEKLRELAVKYGAVPEVEGDECRDVSGLCVTIKVNIFGAYQNKFYMNYKLVAPFRGKDKPEVLAEQPKKATRKRAATSAKGSEGDEPAAKKRGGVKEKKELDFSAFKTEDELVLALVKSGVPMRQACQQAMDHFESREKSVAEDASATLAEMPTFTATSRAGGAGAGSADL